VTRSATLRVSLGIGLSLVFLVVSMRGVDLGEMTEALSHARYWTLIPAMGAVVLSFFLRAVRWQLILRSLRPVSLHDSYAATMIGFMANNILPMRIGEVVRAVVIGRRAKVSRSSALATVAVERVFDVVILLAVLVLGSAGYELPESIRGAIGVLGVGTVLILGVLVVLSRRQRVGTVVTRFPGGRSRIGRKVAETLDKFQDGFGIFRDAPTVVLTLLLSVLVWGGFVVAYHYSLVAFGLDLSLRAPLFLLGVVSIGVMLPSAPGYIGTMQYFFAFAVEPFGVDRAVALSASWFFWFAQYVPVTLLGLGYFAHENVTLRGVMNDPDVKEDRPEKVEGGVR